MPIADTQPAAHQKRSLSHHHCAQQRQIQPHKTNKQFIQVTPAAAEAAGLGAWTTLLVAASLAIAMVAAYEARLGFGGGSSSSRSLPAMQAKHQQQAGKQQQQQQQRGGGQSVVAAVVIHAGSSKGGASSASGGDK